ncbi:PMP-22/EMP/MP20/Claudin superfamily, partial [Trinorchestia longiramus]
MARSMIALFIVSFFFVFVAFFTGVAGCWRRSPGNVASTAILMLLSCLFAAGGMGLWHGVEYYEEERRDNEEHCAIHQMLVDSTHIWYDWSYMLAWIGVNWALISSLLFFGASVCLRSESDREEAKNMTYIMPVYPQKQQYPTYGYGYPGPAAY